MKLLFTTAIAAFVASTSTAIDCKWSSDTHAIDCPYHTYVDRATGKLTHVQYSTKPFSRPLDKKDTQTYYEHDDSRTDNNGTASFSYFFNIGTNVDPTDPVLKKDGCGTTYGADNKPLSGPAMAFQKDDNRDFKCHRIAGDVTVPENVVVGPISDDDPTVGFFMTVKGGDDCSDTWRGGSGGYEKRSFTLQVFCDTSSEAIGRLPEIETVDELVTCMYSLDVYSSHGCPKSCPRAHGASGGAYGSTCNGPAGTCVTGDRSAAADARLEIATVGQPVCVCDSSEGWTGPKCDKKCPRDAKGETTCNNGHCAYDPVVDAGKCFCYTGYSGTHCQDNSPAAPDNVIVESLDGGTIFGWVLVVFGVFGLIGFLVYHKRSNGEWGGSAGGGGGANDYGHL